MSTIRLGKRTEHRSPRIRDLVPLADLGDLVFGAWDPIPDDAYESCRVAGVLDTQHLDLAQRAGLAGIQEWLSFYFKSPMAVPELTPEHDLFIQHAKLKNTLRWLMGEEQITHLGVEYYQYERAGTRLMSQSPSHVPLKS